MALLMKLVSFRNVNRIRHSFVRFVSFQDKFSTNKNTLAVNLIYQKRNVSFLKTFYKPTTEKLRTKDKVPPEFELIYRNVMSQYLVAAQIFTTVSSAIVTVITIIEADIRPAISFDSWRIQPKNAENEIPAVLVAFLFICISLQVMIMKMPVRIYSHLKMDKYLFVFHGNLPLTTKHLTSKTTEIVKLEGMNILPWKNARFEINNKLNVILMENYFRKPADFNILAGYQKRSQ